MVTALLAAGADVNSPHADYRHTALIWASYKGNKSAVVLLLVQFGIKLDVINIDGDTALMAAAEQGHAEIVEMLLKAGANVSITDKARRDGDFPRTEGTGEATGHRREATGHAFQAAIPSQMTPKHTVSELGYRALVAIHASRGPGR